VTFDTLTYVSKDRDFLNLQIQAMQQVREQSQKKLMLSNFPEEQNHQQQ
jgi:hypothetical protein